MRIRWRRVLMYLVPLALNIALSVYLVWQLGYMPAFDRHTRLQMFALLYAVGGIVVAVSGVTAFTHATARERAQRGWYALSLINTIIPTVLLLLMLRSA